MVSLCKPAWISVILFGIFTVPSYATVTNHIGPTDDTTSLLNL